MFKLIYIIAISIILLSTSCKRQKVTDKDVTDFIDVEKNEPAIWDTLYKQIPKVELPCSVSVESYFKGIIEFNYLAKYFNGISYQNLDGGQTKITIDNRDQFSFYYINKPYESSNFFAFNTYEAKKKIFYLFTFTKDGKYIDGLEVAWLDREEEGSTIVSSVIHKDLKIETTQTFLSKKVGVKNIEGIKKYHQIDNSGKIYSLDKTDNSTSKDIQKK